MNPRVFAHRGASSEFPEHTAGAYERAIEVGVDGLECDVRMTADGELVLVHDSSVARTTDSRGRVESMTLAQLRALDWGSWRRWAPPHDSAVREAHGHRLLTLTELFELRTLATRPPALAIETKHPSPYGPAVEEAVIAELDRWGWLSDPEITVMSFSRRACRTLSEQARDLPVTLLTSNADRALRAGQLPPGVTRAGVEIRLLRRHPELAAAHRRAGHEIHPWTVDNYSEVELCVRSGAEALTTNRPKEILLYLSTRAAEEAS